MTLQTRQIDLSREPAFRLGAAEVRPSTREIVTDTVCEIVEPRVMQVLVTLARRRGEVVSRDELIANCWSGRAVSDDAINRCIGRIRRLAEVQGGFALETIPRIGYRLTEHAVSAQDPEPENPTTAPPPEPKTGRVWYLVAALAVLVVIAISGLAYWLLQPAARQPARFTIAVLPFTPAPGDREAEQLGRAVSERIADALVQEGLEVISPAKSRLYSGASKAEAAKALQADFVIDGEIRREGGMINVPVRVIDATSGTTLVADTVRAPAEDASSLPEMATVSALGCGWGLLQSLDRSHKWDFQVIAGSMKAIKHLAVRSEVVYAYDISRQLAASAPDNAYAQYLHAMTAAIFMTDTPPDQRLPLVLEARTAAHRTLQIDPNYGDAYAALNRVTPSFRWAERERGLKRGLILRPSSPLAYMDLLALRMSAGYIRSGAYMAEEAYSNHPNFGGTTLPAISARLWLGDADATRALIARAMKLYPNQPAFAAKMFEATAFNNNLAEAEALFDNPAAASFLQPQGEGLVYHMIVAALRDRRATNVDAVVGECMKVQGRTDELRQICFVALVKLGRLDDAYRMADLIYPDQRGANESEAERRWLNRIPMNTAYLVMPATAPLRADPRYQVLVERVGLLQFWKERGTPPDFCATEKVAVCALLKHA